METVIDQADQLHEIIVVDDGSTDDSAKQVENAIAGNARYAKVLLIKQKNGGVSKARNTGIRYASGSHVAFIDADDKWLSGYIEKITQLYQKFPKARTFATAYIKTNGEQQIKPKIRLNKMKQDGVLDDYFKIASKGDLPFTPSSVCIEKQLLEAIGGFPLGETMGEDQDVWSKISLCSAIAYSPEPLSCYVLDAENRACQRNLPKEECPFSKRLHTAVVNNDVTEAMQAHILKYTATHLIHLAGLLIDNNELNSAEALLNDRRCKMLRLKWLRQKTKLALANTLVRYRNFSLGKSNLGLVR